MATTFLDIQNGWYNSFLQGMGQSQDSFQILQPAPPMVDLTGQTQLTGYMNNIPPYSLTQNYILSGGNRFFDNWKGLLSALNPATSVDVKKDIGTDNWNNWLAYLVKLTPMPYMSQMSQTFRSWATIFAPDVANIGAADYASIALDPIASAQNAVLLYAGNPPVTPPVDPNWTVGYPGLVAQLAAAPSRSFDFSSSKMNTDTSKSWSGGSNSGFFGLWGNSSSSTSQISTTFAQSTITVVASFQHVLTFGTDPGAWYNSSAMNQAYTHKSGPPWKQSTINWQNTFGAPDGNMQRFMSNLIVCSGMNVTVKSTAVYNTTDQKTIIDSGSSGFWPFYSGSSGSSSTDNKATFDSEGMTITTASVPGIPIVLGGNVLGVQRYLGGS